VHAERVDGVQPSVGQSSNMVVHPQQHRCFPVRFLRMRTAGWARRVIADDRFSIPIAFVFVMRAWILPMVFVLCGSVVATALVLRGNPGAAVVLLPAFLLIAGLNSPLVFPRSIGAVEARRRSAADGRPVVFWRPGCTYCLRLRIRLGRRARRLHWVDIWRDPAGAAAVRAVNGGNETVPTVVVAGRPHVNPDPAWVCEQLSRSA
jgi:glutaredoxin